MVYHVKQRKTSRDRRKVSIRGKIFGTSERPRLSIFRSNNYIYAQIIDDEKGITIVDYSSEKLEGLEKETKIKQSYETGKELAKRASEKKIKSVVFDRSGYRYHGRVKALADGAREGGLLLWKKKLIKRKNLLKQQK